MLEKILEEINCLIKYYSNKAAEADKRPECHVDMYSEYDVLSNREDMLIDVKNIIRKHIDADFTPGDFISRQALLKEFQETITEQSDTFDWLNMIARQKSICVNSGAENKDGWIPCADRLPDEKVNPISQDFYEYQVTAKFGEIMDVRHYKFGNGHWWNGPGIADKYVIAWKDQPEPYRPEKGERK